MDEQRTKDGQKPEDSVQIYTTVICTLKPEVVAMLRECGGRIRTIIEERSRIKFDGEMRISGTWAEVEEARRLLDEMVSVSSGSAAQRPAKGSEMTKRESDADRKPGERKREDEQTVLQMGRCQHHPCSWRSPVYPLEKAVVLFMKHYLLDEVENIIKEHALFVHSDIDEDSVLIQCCGADEQDAKRCLKRFTNFYRRAEERIWVGEFPYCAMLDDRFCQFLLDRLPCLVQNRPGEDTIIVACEKNQKDDVTDLLHKICAAKHDHSIAETSGIDLGCDNVEILIDRSQIAEEPTAASDFHIKISISRADITTLKADAIICSNDEMMSCSAEVSKRIASLAGTYYRQECYNVVKQNRLQPFDLVTIPTGELGIIINVIVPSFGTPEHGAIDEGTCKKTLWTIFNNGIKRAKTCGISYLALSPLCIDQAGVPSSWVAEVMCRVVMDAIKSKSNLKQICIAHQNTAVLTLIWNEMKKHLEPITVDGKTLKPEVRTMGASSPHEHQLRYPAAVTHVGGPGEGRARPGQCDIPCGFRTSDHIVVLIHQIAIGALRVDAIVSAANEVLGHAFAISKRISDAAGPELARSQRALVNDSGPIPLSHAVITSAGQLPCNYVIHAVVACWPVAHDDEKKKHCLELLRDTITNIIETADQHQLKSIALPAVITGTFGVPKLDAIRIVFEVLTTVKTKVLKEIHLVHAKGQLLSVLGDIFRRNCADEQNNCTALDENTTLHTIRRCSQGPVAESLTPDRITVIIACRDTPFVNADATVCPNDAKLSSSTGIAKEIAKLEGIKYRWRCSEAARQKTLHTSDFVAVESEKFGTIIHVVVPELRRSGVRLEEAEVLSYKALLSETLKKAVNEAMVSDCTRLSLIPLGADQETVAKPLVAEVACRVVVDVINRGNDVRVFAIVHQNPEIVVLIQREMRNQLNSLTVDGVNSNKKKVTELLISEEVSLFEITDLGRSSQSDSILLDQFSIPIGFVTGDSVQVFIHQCPMERLSVDVVVDLITESTGQTPQQLPAGEPVLASDEDSGEENVIHIAVPSCESRGRDGKKVNCWTILTGMVTNIVLTADGNGFASLATPLILSGIRGMSSKGIATTICSVLSKIKTKTLKEIHVVGGADQCSEMVRGALLFMNVLPENYTLDVVRKRKVPRPRQLLIRNGVRIFASCADVEDLNVDAIVCSNDAQLSCSRKPAKNIARLAGTQYLSQCTEAAKRTSLRPSDVVCVETESLGVILHAIVPKMATLRAKQKTDSDPAVKEFLYKTYTNILNEVRKHSFSSVAIPLLGSDEETTPKDMIADIMHQVLMEGLETCPHLKEVHVIDVDGELLKLLCNRFKKASKRIADVESRPQPRQINVKSHQQMQAQSAIPRTIPERKPEIPCGFLINNGLRLCIHKSDITKLHVSAIVNSTDRFLRHGTAIAKAISDAAGPELKDEGDQIIKRSGPIDVSKTVITAAGRLPCKAVIHAVGPRWPSGRDEQEKKRCLKLLRDTITNVMLMADEKDVKTLAMPPIISGAQGFAKDDVARVIYETLTSRKTENLKEIHLVDKTDEMLRPIAKAFDEAIRDKTKKGSVHLDVLAKDLVSASVQRSRTIPRQPFLVHDGVKIFLRDSPIEDIKVDVFVCPNDEKVTSSSGPAKAIADLVGSEYGVSCKRALGNRKKLSPGDVLAVNTGRLGLVINAIVPQPPPRSGRSTAEDDRHYRQVLRKAFESAFEAAKERNVSHLALLPLDPSQCSDEILVTAMCEALASGLNVCQQIDEVHIVDRGGNFGALMENRLGEHLKVAAARKFPQEAPTAAANILRSNESVSVAESQLKPGERPKTAPKINALLKKQAMPAVRKSPPRSKLLFPCGFETRSGVRVFIHKSALSELTVDAIVCFADNKLASASEVKNPLYDIAGPELQREIKGLLAKRETIPASETVVTSAGRLPCKHIIHAVGPNPIRETFVNIIQAADKEGFQSLAMPGMLVGLFGIQHPDVAASLYGVITHATPQSLNEIHLVDISGQSLTVLGDAFSYANNATQPDGKPAVKQLDKNLVMSAIENRLQKTPKSQPTRKPKNKIPCGYETKDKKRVFIHKNPITKLAVDAIVCSVDEHSAHDAGVMESIYRDAGPTLEMEKNKMIVRNGPIPKCGTMITASGELPCHNVIHALGPKWTSASENKNQCLKEARETLVNVIQTADKHGYKSLAMPAAATGIFGQLKPEVAPVVCEVLTATETTSLKEVHLVDEADQSLFLMRDAFFQWNKQRSEDRLLGGVELDQEAVRSAIESRLGDDRKALSVGDRVKVFVSRSDITKAKTDATICANDEKLSSLTELARKIAGLAGKLYEEKCHRAAEVRKLEPSDVVSIDTRHLGLIINAVVPQLSSSFYDYSRFYDYLYKEELCTTFKNAIDEARKRGVSSVALSALGADQDIVPNLWVVDKLCESLLDRLKEEGHRIKEVHVADSRQGIVTFVWSELTRRVSAKSPTDVLRPAPATLLVIHDRVQVYVYRADVTKLKADAVVCPNDARLSCTKGTAKAIAAMAGDVYRQSCKTAAKTSQLQPSDVVGIQTENLGVIINAVVPRVTALFGTVLKYEDSVFRQLLLTTFKNAIEEAKQLGIRSLIITPLGADDEDVPRTWIAEALSEALMDCLKVDHQLNEIHIVDRNLKMLRRLWDELSYTIRRK